MAIKHIRREKTAVLGCTDEFNYRRDKPDSAMGMDLIPVYEEGSSGDDFGWR